MCAVLALFILRTAFACLAISKTMLHHSNEHFKLDRGGKIKNEFGKMYNRYCYGVAIYGRPLWPYMKSAFYLFTSERIEDSCTTPKRWQPPQIATGIVDWNSREMDRWRWPKRCTASIQFDCSHLSRISFSVNGTVTDYIISLLIGAATGGHRGAGPLFRLGPVMRFAPNR